MNRTHPDWTPAIDPDAVCAQTDPEAFFPEEGRRAADAKRICLRCSIRSDCGEWALGQGNDLYGVWGALSHYDRTKIHRQRNAAAAAENTEGAA